MFPKDNRKKKTPNDILKDIDRFEMNILQTADNVGKNINQMRGNFNQVRENFKKTPIGRRIAKRGEERTRKTKKLLNQNIRQVKRQEVATRPQRKARSLLDANIRSHMRERILKKR